ncbi:MAG: hypothetical protein L3K00_07705 [Thermoplasmata archaeon]|nr:hypothetical protein [Thermoplasmata archaeon]
MPPFRATDEQVDREVETLERIARMRLRRYAQEMRQLDRDLSELRKERARRRASAEVPTSTHAVESVA